MFDAILKYISHLQEEKNFIFNIIQTSSWKQKVGNEKDVLPVFVYFDDVETGNGLGSHAGINKFGAIYTYIACLPPYIAARLSSIIFTGLVHTDDMKRTNNERIFRKIIDELNFLRHTGLSIKVNCKLRTFKFQLALILGDNLGINGILEFVQSFAVNFFCRICQVSSEDST